MPTGNGACNESNTKETLSNELKFHFKRKIIMS